MCTQLCLRFRYAEGAGNVSIPFVEKVRWPDEKGSERSGLRTDLLGFVGGSLASMKGPRESNRMAWVIVGWKRPPYSECILRCVGRTWPRVKKVESALMISLSAIFNSLREIGCVLTCSGNTDRSSQVPIACYPDS